MSRFLSGNQQSLIERIFCKLIYICCYLYVLNAFLYRKAVHTIPNNPRVRQVLLDIDRKDFAPHSPYNDQPIEIGYGATISAPHMVFASFMFLVNVNVILACVCTFACRGEGKGQFQDFRCWERVWLFDSVFCENGMIMFIFYGKLFMVQKYLWLIKLIID